MSYSFLKEPASFYSGLESYDDLLNVFSRAVVDPSVADSYYRSVGLDIVIKPKWENSRQYWGKVFEIAHNQGYFVPLISHFRNDHRYSAHRSDLENSLEELRKEVLKRYRINVDELLQKHPRHVQTTEEYKKLIKFFEDAYGSELDYQRLMGMIGDKQSYLRENERAALRDKLQDAESDWKYVVDLLRRRKILDKLTSVALDDPGVSEKEALKDLVFSLEDSVTQHIRKVRRKRNLGLIAFISSILIVLLLVLLLSPRLRSFLTFQAYEIGLGRLGIGAPLSPTANTYSIIIGEITPVDNTSRSANQADSTTENVVDVLERGQGTTMGVGNIQQYRSNFWRSALIPSNPSIRKYRAEKIATNQNADFYLTGHMLPAQCLRIETYLSDHTFIDEYGTREILQLFGPIVRVPSAADTTILQTQFESLIDNLNSFFVGLDHFEQGENFSNSGQPNQAQVEYLQAYQSFNSAIGSVQTSCGGISSAGLDYILNIWAGNACRKLLNSTCSAGDHYNSARILIPTAIRADLAYADELVLDASRGISAQNFAQSIVLLREAEQIITGVVLDEASDYDLAIYHIVLSRLNSIRVGYAVSVWDLQYQGVHGLDQLYMADVNAWYVSAENSFDEAVTLFNNPDETLQPDELERLETQINQTEPVLEVAKQWICYADYRTRTATDVALEIDCDE